MKKAISVEGISKAYRIGLKEEIPDTLVQATLSRLTSPVRNLRKLARLDTFKSASDDASLHWALKDVSFEVEPGEVIGIIGANGAGKSTLLKILSRITQPTEGRAVINGRVSSLLEVGTGFHPELSGRENVYMNGTILGMRKREIDQKFDEIVHFSGVAKFLDTPIKRYSSGMKVRLAFSVAAHLEPEIMVIDEVLAVGDQAFQEKCLGKMHEVASGGRTVLFVSHNMAAVRSLCPKCILLENGRLKLISDTTDVIQHYISTNYRSTSTHGVFERSADKLTGQAIAITRVITYRNRKASAQFECQDELEIGVDYECRRKVNGLFGYLMVSTLDGTVVYEGDSHDTEDNPLAEIGEGPGEFRVKFPPRTLSPGKYLVYLSLASATDIDGPNLDVPGVVAEFTMSDAQTRRGNRRKGYMSCRLDWALVPSDETNAFKGIMSEH